MNVLLLNYEYPPLGGGAGKATARLLQTFADGYPDLRVDAVVSSFGDYAEDRLSERIRLFRLDIGKRQGRHYQASRDLLVYTLKSFVMTRKLLASDRYDLVHAFFAVPCGAVAYLNRRRCPYVVSLRGSDVPYYNDRFTSLYRFITPVIRRICRRAGAVVANSEGLRRLARSSMPRLPVSVIPNGVEPVTGSLERSYEGALRILFVGRLIRRKGVEVLLEAFSRLPDSIDVYLDIAGSGNLSEELCRRAHGLGLRDRVMFYGEVDGEELDRLYRGAHLFVLPSLNEGMSNALLEALAYGIPAVVTDTGGTAELVADNGVIVEKGSVAALHAALEELLTDYERLARMGAASSRVAERFSRERVAAGYVEVYRTVGEGRQGVSRHNGSC